MSREVRTLAVVAVGMALAVPLGLFITEVVMGGDGPPWGGALLGLGLGAGVIALAAILGARR